MKKKLGLADFIDQKRVEIVHEWEVFARSIPRTGPPMTGVELRDHADQILTAIVADMQSHQSASSQAAKSKGHGLAGELVALGRVHAVLRIDNGFKLTELVAEYRALRASVLRLWEDQETDPAGVTRFNEAIDEALSEAVASFTDTTDTFREQTLGVLGHDLRNPLATVVMASSSMLESDDLDDGQRRMLTRIATSAARMTRLVGDLIDLTKTRFGEVITISPTTLDLEQLCTRVATELDVRDGDGSSVVTCTTSGDLRGTWDASRLEQALANLIDNAVKHRARGKVAVTARGDGAEVVVSVHNGGPAIEPTLLAKILEPRVRRVVEPNDTFVGLGLYIAAQIAIAHGGTLTVSSTAEAGTIFSLRLPRVAPVTTTPAT
ncbi:MAG: sensor histidine kinase [Deltaproteobacteria bacterium]|nr:sensor histidine kinase [Deltaproteobacteria bacterium]MDQ3299942.1 sensor histidine kinase [Myxococcota bacterium]